MGLANRLLSPFAKKVLLSFKHTLSANGNLRVVGYPVRREFLSIAIKESLSKNILVIGGSQGSLFINNLISSSAYILLERGFKIVQQAGEKLFKRTVDIYKEQGLYSSSALNIYSFIDDIVGFYEWADIVISRAGAGSVFESLYAKRPTIFIPLVNSADNHQKINAEFAREQGFGVVLEEKNANVENLLKLIDNIYRNYTGQIVNKLKKLNYMDSTKRIIEEVNID
jgi:UDP-N-acetylglucosamine--N-acetylmuramyl-(pentapeptide) pyrophosphoryl-undecaprenol N-acetylglucosamine transferase